MDSDQTTRENGPHGPSSRAAPQKASISFANRAARGVWGLVWLVLFRPSPRRWHGWRRLLLRAFGAHVGARAAVYPSCRVWAPWRLRMEDDSCLGPHVDCYCVAEITLCRQARVSQYSYLCSASHDDRDPDLPLVVAPIHIGPKAWVCADVFVGMGVTVGDGAVVGARSAVFKDVEPWTVVGGNPARFIRKRVLDRGRGEGAGEG